MDQQTITMKQLKKRDLGVWSRLVQKFLTDPRVWVTHVSALGAIPLPPGEDYLIRYRLHLSGHSDPITLIAKRTTSTEANFYQYLAPVLTGIVPQCWFVENSRQDAWVILDEVPNDYPRVGWVREDIEQMVNSLVQIHSSFWDQKQALAEHRWLPQYISSKPSSKWQKLADSGAMDTDKKSGEQLLSLHAIRHAGWLTPKLMQAAEGLKLLKEWGVWPGVLEEKHHEAIADLLDDPVPMLQPLRELPMSLIHGDLYPANWHLNLMGKAVLLDWEGVSFGPAVSDLISLVDQMNLLKTVDGEWYTRLEFPVSDETIIDSYLLKMSALSSDFSARDMRQAVPAARCLHILTTWIPRFTSQHNKADPGLEQLVVLRPYLQELFRRFLDAYRKL